MRRITAILLAAVICLLSLTACTARPTEPSVPADTAAPEITAAPSAAPAEFTNANGEALEKHTAQIFDVFNTTIALTVYTRTDEEFKTVFEYVKKEFVRMHSIFDMYNAYTGVNNLYSVNASAADGPAKAEPELIELLQLTARWREQYSGKNNPALGAVLNLWHDARNDTTYVPSQEDLARAAQHCDYSNVIIDAKAGTIEYLDPELKLDLGAVAKGYTAQIVADGIRALGCDCFLLNAGGNVVCGNTPIGKEYWVIGLEGIDGQTLQNKLNIKNLCIVTSGDYQRYYELDGVRYHHLIDPETLQPGAYVHAFSVICQDSAMGDFLSTALFLTPYEEARAIVDGLDGVEGYWNLMDGSVEMTDGFREYLAVK